MENDKKTSVILNEENVSTRDEPPAEQEQVTKLTPEQPPRVMTEGEWNGW